MEIVMRKKVLVIMLLVAAGIVSGVTGERITLHNSLKAQSSTQNMEVYLSDRGSQKTQLTGGVISTTRDRIEFKEHYVLVTGKEPDKRTWVLAVDEIKVIVGGN